MASDPWLTGTVAVALVLLLFIALLSSLETAILNARRSRLAQLEGDRRLPNLEQILEQPDRFQMSAHLAKSLCEALIYGCAALAGLDAALRIAPPNVLTIWDFVSHAWPGVLVGALIAYLCVTLLGEAVPKSLALRRPERTLLRWCGFVRLFTLVFTPIRWLTGQLGRALAIEAGADLQQAARAARSEEEIMLLVEGSAEEGMLEEDEKEMIHSIFEFTDTIARQVMVPRTDIDSVSLDTPLDAVVQEVMESGHSRLPVYEGTMDNIVGVVHIKDLVPHLVNGNRDLPLRDVMRAPIFVPEGKKIDDLLAEFREHKSQLAIVVDEYGGTAGMVTLEDVLEEIVGEIEDEHDQPDEVVEEFVTEPDGVLVDGRTPLEDVNDRLCLELPTNYFDTLGGFVFSLFAQPPAEGERVTYNGVEFEAASVEGLRLQKVKVLGQKPEEECPDEDDPAAAHDNA